MTELRKVPGPSSPLGGTSGKVVAVVVAGIVLAVIKPWGTTPAEIAFASASPAPTPSLANTASAGAESAFDFGVFEGFEPHPAWEIWPAGREISFGFAMKVEADVDTPVAVSVPSTGASTSPSAAPSPSPSEPGSSADPDPPVWSDTISISPSSTLTVVAINTPMGYRIPTARLSRLGSDGAPVAVPVVRLPSPWPDHFLVIGIADGRGGALTVWPAGTYTMTLDIQPGGWQRSIMIDVRAMPPEHDPSPVTSAAPTPSAIRGG